MRDLDLGTMTAGNRGDELSQSTAKPLRCAQEVRLLLVVWITWFHRQRLARLDSSSARAALEGNGSEKETC